MTRFRIAHVLAAAAFWAATAFSYASLSDLINFLPEKAEKSEAPRSQAASTAVEALQEQTPYALTQNKLLAEIRNELVNHYKLKGELALTPQQPWNMLKLNSDSWKLEITQFPSGGLEPRFALHFKIHSEGQFLGEWSWLLQASLWQEAFIARRQINAGNALFITDFTMRKMDALPLRDTLVPATANLGSFATRRTIAANRPLFWNDLESRALVLKGNMAKVIASHGALEITMSARALENGAIGDVITLRNIDSNKRIQGEVIDENTVRVYF